MHSAKQPGDPSSASIIRLEPIPTPPINIGPVRVDPPVLAAPMAGFTNHAFRQMIRKFGGAGLLVTEMVHARSFVWREGEKAEYADRLWGILDEPRPLAVQIWDNDPEMLARVGGRLAHEYSVSVVDINFGCPVRNVTRKARSGSYLLQKPDRIGQIVERVVVACRPTPVTAKIRLGYTRDTINAIDVAQAVENAGAAALTVHGRTAEDMFRGTADWGRIAAIRPYLKRIPLIGNGDLDSVQSVIDAFQHFDVNGVMIGRACLGKPWLFAQVKAALDGEPVPPEPSPNIQRGLLLHHYELVCRRFGDTKGTILMRKYACFYAQGRPGARAFRREVARAVTPEAFLRTVERLFP
ncbi:MAG: tRNA-dihydrouridine synthase [Pirellulales bacterium]|nr:tRNA-dihydrouridine synthase [Pirellulales bacterium]